LELKRIEKESIALTIYFEEKSAKQEGRADSFRVFKDTFHVSDTVQSVINKIAENAPEKIQNNEDSCALFLPTRKSKKGVFMEKNRTLQSYNLSGMVRITDYILEIQYQHCSSRLSTLNL
jgi:hypothetical protein